MRVYALVALFAVHAVVTAIAVARVGYVGIFEAAFANWGAGQVFSDLTVSLLVLTGIMLRDARQRGVNAWPFVVLALPLGSFAPLAYFLLREWQVRSEKAVDGALRGA